VYQVLRTIPIKTPWFEFDIPIYGFGTMLVLALFVCTWVASRRAQREGIARERIQDLALWVVICGILGARVVYMIQYQQPLSQFLLLWQGGLVFYGSLIGGTIGLLLAHIFVLRKYNLPWLKLADVIAPSLAIGLSIGRIGCLLNGCCYGEVACPSCLAITFPLSAPARYDLVGKGLQTTAGFTTGNDPTIVDKVEPGSPAEKAGLQAGDKIVAVDGLENVVRKAGDRPSAHTTDVLTDHLAAQWPRGQRDLQLTVRRSEEEIELPAFEPRTLGLHPTQLYETISTLLLFLLLTAYYPFHRIDGQVMGLFLALYAVHRFLNESLRNDTAPVAFGMTLSQNGSILILLAGLILLNRDRVARVTVPVRRLLLGR
jgi:phosphatidylglycerol:prolipoprotein diacylglycerol transferase